MRDMIDHTTTGKRPLAQRALAIAASALLACATAIATCPDTSWADVRKTDAILGTTVEQRGLSALLCPSVDATHVVVVGDDGTVYFERDASSEAKIASITKVMTAVVALEYAPLDTPITVSAEAASVGESSAHLLAGDVLELEDALKALMIPSGNDAAIAIAQNLGKLMLGSASASDDEALSAFVDAMNEKAASIGCENTVYENPHGLDNDRFSGDFHSTASDVAQVVAYAMDNETFREIVANDGATIQVTREGQPASIELESTDELLGVYEGACGVKTGFTTYAGACFAGAANRDGRELYAIILNSSSEAQRFVDAETLFDWVYDNWVSYPLANSSQTTTMTLDGQQREVPVVARVALASWPDKTVDATFSDPDAAAEVFALNGNVSQSFEFNEVSGSVHAGDVVGKATFYQHNEVIATLDVIACEDVAAPGIFEGIGIWWSRLVGGATTAESVILNDTPLIYDKQATSAR